jgi:RNA polymerase sigma-70 factor (ECF subfamily)
LQEPDPETIRAAAAGDHVAFAVIVRMYQLPIWRFLRGLLGDSHLAEDVAQDAFVRAHAKLHTFRYRSKFSTWIFSIARNAGIDAIRKQQRALRLVERAQDRPPLAAGAPDARAELSAALASLSPDHREAFLAIEVLGLPYRDAAAALSVPEGTVKSRVFHARKALLEWMQSGEAADEA